jgi:hypothetical protein
VRVFVDAEDIRTSPSPFPLPQSGGEGFEANVLLHRDPYCVVRCCSTWRSLHGRAAPSGAGWDAPKGRGRQEREPDFTGCRAFFSLGGVRVHSATCRRTCERTLPDGSANPPGPLAIRHRCDRRRARTTPRNKQGRRSLRSKAIRHRADQTGMTRLSRAAIPCAGIFGIEPRLRPVESRYRRNPTTENYAKDV